MGVKSTSFGGISATQHAAIEHTSEMIGDETIKNADISSTAAIAESKLALNYATHPEDHHARHESGGADVFTSPLPLAAIPATLTGKDADTVDGVEGAVITGHHARHEDGGADEIINRLNHRAMCFSTEPSDKLRHSNDTERTVDDTDNWTKIKEMLVNEAIPACRVKMDIKLENGNSNYPMQFAIFKNGNQVGAIHETGSGAYTTISDDLTGLAVGDLLQVYTKRKITGSATWPPYVRNMRIYYDFIWDITLAAPTNQDPV